MKRAAVPRWANKDQLLFSCLPPVKRTPIPRVVSLFVTHQIANEAGRLGAKRRRGEEREVETIGERIPERRLEDAYK